MSRAGTPYVAAGMVLFLAGAFSGNQRVASAAAAPNGRNGNCFDNIYSLWQLDLGATPRSKRVIRRHDGMLDVSGDGRWITYAAYDRLVVATVRGKLARTVASDPDDASAEVLKVRWSPNGRQIAFVTWPFPRTQQAELYAVRRDGSALRKISDVGLFLDWSPDASRLAFLRNTAPDRTMLVVAAADGSHELAIAPARAAERPVWSPDGRWIAYHNDRDDRLHIIRPDGSGDRRIRIFSSHPSWSPNARRLVFTRGYGRPVSRTAPAFGIADLRGRPLRSFAPGDGGEAQWSPRGGEIVYSLFVTNRDSRLSEMQLFSIRPDGTRARQLTRDPNPNVDPTKAADVIESFSWVRSGPWKGRRIFYLRPACK